MPTIEERSVFTNQILAPVCADTVLRPNRYRNSITGFLAIKGREYSTLDGGLMAIGRSVNGWGDSDIIPAHLCDQELRENFAGKVVQWSTGEDGNCPMHHYWGYNTPLSPFGRVLRGVVRQLEIPDFDEAIWPSYLVWSNLYKLSPSDGGNPRITLRNAQRPGCIDLLRVELKTYRPDHLLFLTGLNDWADPFLEALEINDVPMPTDPNFLFVEKFGRLTHHNNQLCKVVIACHPQTRPEGQWVNEVMEAFHRLDG